MKVFFIFSFVMIATISAHSFSQETINLHLKNSAIKDVLSEIEKKSDYIFILSDNAEAEMNRKIDVEAVSKSVIEILKQITEKTDLKYDIFNKQIVVYKSDNSNKASFIGQKTVAIKGRVTDKQGNPLPGVTIMVKGTNKGTSTDEDGRFLLNLEQADSPILHFSYIGFQGRDVKADLDKVMHIVMEESVSEIGEVVITGFGTKSKNSYTGSQTTVTKDQLISAGTKNVLASIQAFVPGMQIVPDNAAGSNPNTKPEINIRGRASFEGAANLPIFVVDGAQVQLDYIYDMDINDIELVSVLKDASASALYGAKASAGVIVITTKALSGGKLKFNYSGTIRASMPDLSGYNLLNAEQKLEYERLAGLYTGEGSDQYGLDNLYAEKFQIVRSGVNTDWLSKPLRNGISQNHNLSVDGGDENARYNVGIRYGKEEGVMKGSSRERVSSFFKLSYNKNKAFYLSNSSNVSWVKAIESHYGSFIQYAQLNPYDTPYDENGEYRKELSYKAYNPLYEASIGNFDKKEQFYFMNTTDLQLWLLKSLRLDASFSIFKGINEGKTFLSPFSKDEVKKADASTRGSLTEKRSSAINYSGKLILSYNRYLSEKLFLTTMGGTNIESNASDESGYKSIGFYSDKLAHAAFATKYPVSDSPSGSDLVDRSVGFFVNANAIHDNKYFLDVIYRYEGSSKFGKNSRFAPFWSIGSGWNIHNEKFMKNFNVQLLKLRGSVGYLGNISFSPYQSITTYRYMALLNYLKGQGAVPITIGNPDLKWERTLNTNIGLDLTMFKNRWDLSLDLYLKNTDNLLLDVTKAPSIGISEARENIGAIENKGIEMQTRIVPVTTKDWHWAISLNYSYNKNKIKSISDALRLHNEKNIQVKGTQPLPVYEEGESLTALKVVPSAGIDPATGQEIYIKRNGEYTFSYDANDKVTFGDTSPYATGKFGSYLTWKQFSMSLLFDYSLGGMIYNSTLASRVEGSNPQYNADIRVFNDRWKQPGDVAKYKDIADKQTPMQTSRFVEINNYVSLQSLSLAYDFDSKWIEKWKLRRLRLEMMMNDLFYLSSVKRERGLSYPFSRSIELSVRVSF